MAKVLGLVSQEVGGYAGIKNDLDFTLEAALAKDNNVTLFRYEDMQAWVIFTCVFAFLIIFIVAIFLLPFIVFRLHILFSTWFSQ